MARGSALGWGGADTPSEGDRGEAKDDTDVMPDFAAFLTDRTTDPGTATCKGDGGLTYLGPAKGAGTGVAVSGAF